MSKILKLDNKILRKSLIISNLKYSTTLSYEFIKPTYAIPIRVP